MSNEVYGSLCFIAASAVPRIWLYQSIGLRLEDAFKDGFRGSDGVSFTRLFSSRVAFADRNDKWHDRLFYRVHISKTPLYVASLYCHVRKSFWRIKI